jgi:hypothetical protein
MFAKYYLGHSSFPRRLFMLVIKMIGIGSEANACFHIMESTDETHPIRRTCALAGQWRRCLGAAQ